MSEEKFSTDESGTFKWSGPLNYYHNEDFSRGVWFSPMPHGGAFNVRAEIPPEAYDRTYSLEGPPVWTLDEDYKPKKPRWWQEAAYRIRMAWSVLRRGY